MDAIISGRAGVALLMDDSVWSSFDVDDPDTLLPRRQSDARLLFGEATDLVHFENVDHAQAAEELELAFNRASALDLALILLDSELPDDIRTDAAEELERLLADESVVEYLENILYGRPLPAASDIEGALARCSGGRLPKLSAVLQILEAYQPIIGAVCAAWDALPLSLFDGEDQKAEFQRAAVRAGLFRQLVGEVANGARGRVDQFMLSALLNPDVKAQRNHLGVLRQWTGPFRKQAAAPTVRHEVEDFLEETPVTRRGGRGRRKRRSAEEELSKLQGQLDLITSAMGQRDLDFARKITDQVVNYQLKTTRRINVAKTLCNLATEAKALGIYPLQLELTERAIEIAPDDGWSWAQYADALLKLQRPTEALKAYEQAESFGAGAIASRGRAEVLKALGRLQEALAVYNAVLAEDLGDVVARSGRAETLKALGRLRDALDAYDSIVAERPEDVVAKSGRAETLKSLGRLKEALAAYDSIVAERPEDVVAKSGRAETLRALGRLPEALAAYDSIVAERPESVVAKRGRAETLRALGRLNHALAAYDDIAATHSEDVITKAGRAETLRALGRLDDALDAYNSIVAEHPESVVARNGRAETLKALGRLRDALDAYDLIVAEHPESVVARNGRAEVLKALGRFNEALAAYDVVLANNPYNPIVRNGRCGVLIALRRYDEALESLPDEKPVTLGDWIGYHMRGMIMLRTGEVDFAIEIFEHGAKDDPIPSSREYFRNALAVACLRRKDYQKAEIALEGVSTPLMQPQANVFRLHAFGARGKDAPAAAAYENLRDKPWFIPDELVAELHRRYILKEQPRHDDAWVSEQEEDTLLFDPSQQVLSISLLAAQSFM